MEELDFLLLRDWFVDEESIYDLLDWSSDEAFNYVYDNRSRYSERVRMVIEPNDWKGDYKPKLKLKWI
jgi:hypothetical protein